MSIALSSLRGYLALVNRRPPCGQQPERLEIFVPSISCKDMSRTELLYKMSSMSKKPPIAPISPQFPQGDDGLSVVLERRTQKSAPPQMYQVVMLNDDFTPMEFVVAVIQEFFSKDREAATQIMLKIHLDGKAVCGVYSRDVAATKVDQVMDAAQRAGHPLQCVSEPLQ